MESSSGKCGANEGVRINKYLAQQGLCTRREADGLISAGKVLVDGKPAVLGQKVSQKDEVKLIESPLDTKKYVYYAYYKPQDVITHSPEKGETDILASSGLKGVFPIGRLDKDSEGLIILTNDGRVTERLLSPRFEHEKEYVVKAGSRVTKEHLSAMEKGMRIRGEKIKPCRTKRLSDYSFSIILTEGKKRQIREMCRLVELPVKSLKRIRIMNIKLGGLKVNRYRELEGKELEEFKKGIGLK